MVTNFLNYKLCNGCSACMNACPACCIKMSYDKEGFLYPKIDKKKCLHCGLCEKICPVLKEKPVFTEDAPTVYAVKTKNESLRLKSSSGGLFTEIAEKVIEKGGVVFGAAFDEQCAVRHTYTETKEGIGQFRGSKYVQSAIGESYKKAKEFLENGRTVLFSGTPCQIGGLFAYLKKDYDNLLTQDFICHGVPSFLVWRKYCKHLEKKYKSKISGVFFKDKTTGWHEYSVKIKFENGKVFSEKASENLYMRAFISNLCLRPSCYQCRFKGLHRVSDITLGDFWGVEKVLPEMDDDKGVSLLFLHNEKANRLLNGLIDENRMVYKKIDPDLAIKDNSSMVCSAKTNGKRDVFMRAIAKRSFKKSSEIIWGPTAFQKIKEYADSVVDKIKRLVCSNK